MKRSLCLLLIFAMMMPNFAMCVSAEETQPALETVQSIAELETAEGSAAASETAIAETEAEMTTEPVPQTTVAETAAETTAEVTVPPEETAETTEAVEETTAEAETVEETTAAETAAVEAETEPEEVAGAEAVTNRLVASVRTEMRTVQNTVTVREVEILADGSYAYRDKTVTAEYEVPADQGIRTADITADGNDYRFSTFADLKELAGRNYDAGSPVSFSYIGTEALTIEESLALPANASLGLFGKQLNIPEHVTLSVGTLDVGTICVDGTVNAEMIRVYVHADVTGAMNADNVTFQFSTYSALDNISGQINVVTNCDSMQELKDTLEEARADSHANHYYDLHIDVLEITESVVFPANCWMVITRNTSVAPNVTVTLNGSQQINNKLTVAGTLVNNGSLFLDGILQLEESGSFVNNGELLVDKNGRETPAASLPGFDLTQWEINDQEGREWVWELKDAKGLTKLAAPANLEWGIHHNHWVWDPNTQQTVRKEIAMPGSMSWQPGSPAQSRARINVYREGNPDPVYRVTWNFGQQMQTWLSVDGLCKEPPASGTYYFTVQSLGDHVTYCNSDVVKSGTWTYVRPADTVGVCTNLSWNWPSVNYSLPENLANINGFEIQYYYASVDGSWNSGIRTSSRTGTAGYYPQLHKAYLEQYGYGEYYFEVRALSGDITKALSGSWSEMSPGYTYSETSGETQPPETDPPETEPEETKPKETEPPETEPPETTAPPAREELDAPKLEVSNRASDGKPSLSWSKVSGAKEYQVYRSTSKSGSFKRITTTDNTSFVNTSTTAGKTYYYKVRAVAADGEKSEYSKVVSRICKLSQPDLDSYSLADTGKIKLHWKKVEGAVKYEIYRATSKNGEFSRLGSTKNLYYTNSKITAGKTYYYKIKAVPENEDAASAFSNRIYRTCDLPRPEISLSTVDSSGKIKVSWKAISGAEKYEVYRATSEKGEYSKISTTTNTSATDTKAVAGTKYYYKVKAIHDTSAANSAYSTVKSATCDLACPGIGFTNDSKTGYSRIMWAAVEGASKYEVYCATSKSGKYSLLWSTSEYVAYNHANAELGKTYYYKVRAVHKNSAANSAYSDIVSGARKLGQPQVTSIGSDASTGNILLKWKAVENAAYYRVYRSTSKNGTYKCVEETKGLKFLDWDGKTGKTYYYKVRAFNKTSGVNSAYSEIKDWVDRLPAPQLHYRGSSTGNPSLHWKAITGATGYEVYRSTKKDSGYVKIKVTCKTEKEDGKQYYYFVDDTNNTDGTRKKAGTTYYYKVRAIHDVDRADSWYSEPYSTLQRLAVPTVTKSITIALNIKLSWKKVQDAKKYEVYRKRYGDSEYKLWKTTTSTSVTDRNHGDTLPVSYYVVAVHKNAMANSCSKTITVSSLKR